MLHPLFSAAIERPDLFVKHFSGYVALVGEETKSASAQLLGRIIAGFLAALCAAVFLMMTGVAIMLGFLQGHLHWVLVAVPASALVVTLLAVLKAVKPATKEAFVELKTQLDKDLEMFNTPT